MKIKELRATNKEDLKLRLIELRKDMIKHNAQISTGGGISSPGQIKKTKKTIAKILTILNEKESKKVVTQKEASKDAGLSNKNKSGNTQVRGGING